MGFGKLLEEKMKERGIKQAELAEAVGLPKTTLSSMIQRDNTKIEIEIFLKICEHLDCNPEDFYTEYKKQTAKRMPPLFASKYHQLDEHGKDMVNMVLEMEFDRCITISKSEPSITVHRHLSKASAGYGYDLSDEDEWKEIKVIDEPAARNADFAVEIEGNSMQPEYNDGDVVFVVYDSDVPVGKVGLFRQNGRGYIKERGKKYLISTNDKFPHIYPEDGEIECIGRVIGIATVVD